MKFRWTQNFQTQNKVLAASNIYILTKSLWFGGGSSQGRVNRDDGKGAQWVES